MGVERVETSIKAIEVYRMKEEGEGKCKGHIDVRIRLIRDGAQTAADVYGDVVGLTFVRVFFTSEDVPLRELIDSAFLQAQRSLRQIAAHCILDPQSSDRGSLWIE